MKFDNTRWGFQGDAEKPNLLHRLADRNPDVKFVVVGHNDAGEFIQPNIENPWHNAREKAAAMPPVNDGYYRTPFPPYWTAKPAWWCSEVSGFEDDLVKLISELDGIIIHVGQHAPTQIRIPQTGNTWQETFTNPDLDANKVYDSMQTYCRYIIRGINALGDKTLGQAPVVWLVPDPRNYIKARDIKWTSGTWDILAQYTFTRNQRHERYCDPRTPADVATQGQFDWPSDRDVVRLERGGELWNAKHNYRHCDLELMILSDHWTEVRWTRFSDRVPAGVATTSTKASVMGEKRRRSQLVNDYLLAAFPDAEVYGKWDKASLDDVPVETLRETTPDEFYELLDRFRVTLSLPIVESGWSVAKQYQCWAARSVCFMVEQVDDQGWTLPSRRKTAGTKSVGNIHDQEFYSVRDDWTNADLILAYWLRVETPDEFAQRAKIASTDEGWWNWLTNQQLDLLSRRWNAKLLERTIEERLGITVV
jgi:hypothetical protein